MNIMLQDESDFVSANIYIQPPENGNDTDQDSGSEDSGGTVDNLTGRQLWAEASATIFTSDHQKTVIENTQGEAEFVDVGSRQPKTNQLLTQTEW